MSNGARRAPQEIKMLFAVLPLASLYFLYCLTAKQFGLRFSRPLNIWLQSVDKKLAEQMLKILAELMMLGRGFYIIPIVGAQRPDATFFASSRDNFQACLALGNLSREGRKMVFPDEVVGTVTQCGKREGHLYIDGVGLEKICVANITDIGVLDTIIREAMSR